MKKVLSFIAIAGIAASVVACGPSKEQLEKEAQRKKDSIAADSASRAEAAAMAQKAIDDSLAAVAATEKAKALADSLHNDSIVKKLIKPVKK